MKKLDTSAIAPGVSFPFKGGTLLFLQLAYQEVVQEIVTSRIGASYDATKAYILNGCINTGTGSNYIISAGSIFFNGEIYLVPAVAFTIAGSNVAEGVLTTTQYTADADAVIFTDNVSRNVHNIRSIVFQQGLAGSGIVDFVNLINLSYKPIGSIGQTTMWLMPGAGSQASQLSTYFNTSIGLGIHALTLGWAIDTTLSGFVPAGYKNGDAVYGTIGSTHGADSHVISATDLPPLVTANDFAVTAGSSVSAYIKGANSANTVGPETVNVGSPNNAISLIQSTVIKLYITRYY